MRVNHFCQFETGRRCRDAPRCSPARVRERARFCFGADARKQHGAGNAYHASRFVRPQFVGHLWNAESLKWFWKQKGFFFNPRENWSCSILLSARESQRGQVRSVGGSISVLCHSVPFDANTGSLKVRNVPIRGKMLFILFFFYFVLWAIATTTPTAEIRGRGDIVTTKSRQAKKHNQMTNHLFYSGERNEKIRGNVRNITQAVRRVLQSKRTDLFYENFFLIQQPPRIFRMTSFVSAFQKPFTQLGDCFVICRCWRLSSLDNATQEKLFLSDWGQQSSPSTQRMC